MREDFAGGDFVVGELGAGGLLVGLGNLLATDMVGARDGFEGERGGEDICESPAPVRTPNSSVIQAG